MRAVKEITMPRFKGFAGGLHRPPFYNSERASDSERGARPKLPAIRDQDNRELVFGRIAVDAHHPTAPTATVPI